MHAGRKRRLILLAGLLLLALGLVPGVAQAATATSETPGQEGTVAPQSTGSLDCNGLSPTQHPVKVFYACSDPRNASESDDRFEENGTYIGHDEPALNFTSSQPGSGSNVSWTFKLGQDPTHLPTDSTPGKDVSHYFELTPALWFSMNICDPQSYPILPCRPRSDANAPTARYPGGGSAFMELQFYPPGFAPWADAPSFDNSHWGAALTIDSLAGTYGFTNLNYNCVEPVNFSFIQTNGIPPGPPSPQLSNLSSDEPNAHTLLMNPGDTIHVHIFDPPVPDGSGNALKVVVHDLTTGKTGYMQASAANGFMNTSIVDCSGTPFNFEPEYSTAKPTNVSPWGAGTEVISAAFETGHFEPCTGISGPGKLSFGGSTIQDPFWSYCSGPYENAAAGGDGGNSPEVADAPCFPKGDTHQGLAANAPDEITGCLDELYQNGDLDFDGSAYYHEWPTSTTPTARPSTFQFSPPTFGSTNTQYDAFQFQTDAAFSELTTCNPGTPQGCTVPPPNAPGGFYPYWTLTGSGSSCLWEFGNMNNGQSFGGMRQYGSLDPQQFPEIRSANIPNTCTS